MTQQPRYVLICRLDNAQQWDQISNPKPSDFEKAETFLHNVFNEYVEWLNCGVVYRFVRREDLAKYEQPAQPIVTGPTRWPGEGE